MNAERGKGHRNYGRVWKGVRLKMWFCAFIPFSRGSELTPPMPDFHNAMAGGQVTERLPATLPTPGDVLEVLVRNSRRVPQLEELDMGDVVVYTRQVVGIHNLTSLKYVRPRVPHTRSRNCSLSKATTH